CSSCATAAPAASTRTGTTTRTPCNANAAAPSSSHPNAWALRSPGETNTGGLHRAVARPPVPVLRPFRCCARSGAAPVPVLRQGEGAAPGEPEPGASNTWRGPEPEDVQHLARPGTGGRPVLLGTSGAWGRKARGRVQCLLPPRPGRPQRRATVSRKTVSVT